MDIADNAYCRLCAELIPNSKLINLLADHTQRKKIAEKLARLNAGSALKDLRQDVLPKTVCLVCTNSLDRAFQFIIGVELAQGVLNNLILSRQIKEETRKSCDENVTYEPPEDIKDVVKEESRTSKKNFVEEFRKYRLTDGGKCLELVKKSEVKIKGRGRKKLNKDDSRNEVISFDEENSIFLNDPLEDVKDVIEDEDVKCLEVLQKSDMQVNKHSRKKLKNIVSRNEVSICDEENSTSSSYELPLSFINIEDVEEPDTGKLQKLDVPVKNHLERNVNYMKGFGLDAIPLSQLELTWADYSWKCSHCETQFSNIDELKIHSMKYHKRCNTFGCTDCNSRKSVLDVFLKHIENHRKQLSLSCYKCHAKFLTPRDAITHHRSVHKNTKHVCRGCNMAFLNQEELKQHMELYYKENRARNLTNNLTCAVCERTFKTITSLNKHLLIHTERKRDYICDKCGKSYFSKDMLTTHMVKHRNVEYRCEICKAVFNTQTSLLRHVGVHDKERPIACKQCGHSFRLQRQLKSHLKRHTDVKSYVCSFCDKHFRYSSSLAVHIRQHTGVKPYSCELCERGFVSWSNYNKHMTRSHGRDMSKIKRTPDGIFPVNPTTGKMIKPPETNKIKEWKRKLLERRQKNK